MINAGMKLLLRRILALLVCLAVLSPALATSSCNTDCHMTDVQMDMTASDMMPTDWSSIAGGCSIESASGPSQHCDDPMGQCSYFGPTPQLFQSNTIFHDTNASEVDRQTPIRIQSSLFKPPRMTNFKHATVS